MRYRANNRIGIISLIASVAVILAVAAVSVQSLFQRDKEITTRLIFETLNVEVEKEFEYPIFITNAMQSDVFLRDFLEDEATLPVDELSDKMGRYLNAISTSNRWDGVYFSSARTLYYYTPEGIAEVLDPASDPYDQWYFDFIASGRDYNLDVEFDQYNSDIWTVFIDKRMEDEAGNLIGVCTVGMRMDELQERIRQLEEKYGVSIYFTDRNGHVQIGTEHIASALFYQSLDSENAEAIDRRELKSARTYIVFQYVPMLDWYLVVVNDQSIFTGVVSSHIYIAFGVVILLLLLVLTANLALSARQKRTLANSAETDPLTKVFNRRGARKRIDVYLMSGDRLKQGGAIFLMDMDNFKNVNDTMGHVKGDAVLVEAAQILVNSFRSDDIICRIGGDEFLVFCPGMVNRDTITRKAEQVLEAGKRTIEEGDKRVEIGMSIGIVIFPEHGDTLEKLSKNADKALYAAKDGGRRSYRVYNSPVEQ